MTFSRASGRIVLCIALCAPALAAAQSRPRATARRPETRGLAVRAEYAAVLLQAERYREAAKEYRALLEIDSTNAAYRLGLARALAWDERFREADRELRSLLARRPVNPAVPALARAVRSSYQPRVSEAAAWVAERPDYAPYRVALAQALVREHRGRDAIAQYDTLLAARDSAALLIGLADAYAASGDRAAGIERVRGIVERQPADTAVRHAFAMVLAAARRYDEAVAQYDTLLAQSATAPLYLDRARVNIARDRETDAVSDVQAALAMKPTVDAYLLLGDLHRQAGSFGAAEAAYQGARMLGPRDPRVASRFALLAREARPVIAFIPEYDEATGWATGGQAQRDNLGMSYGTLAARRGVALPRGAMGSIGVEYRQLGAENSFESRSVRGLAVDAGAARALTYGILGGRAGIAAHSSAPAVPYFSLAATGWIGAVAGTIEAAAGPSYRELLTLASLDDRDGRKTITERSLRLSLGGPLGLIDLAASGERALMSDGNTRLTFEGIARYPLTTGLAAVYSLTALRFAERSDRYWDPRSYTASALGIEAAARPKRGFTGALRLLPGVAQTDETGSLARVTAGNGTRSVVGQFSASGEVGFRARHWELAVAGSYGRGRSGGYERGAANALLRLTP